MLTVQDHVGAESRSFNTQKQVAREQGNEPRDRAFQSGNAPSVAVILRGERDEEVGSAVLGYN